MFGKKNKRKFKVLLFAYSRRGFAFFGYPAAKAIRSSRSDGASYDIQE